LIGTDPPTDKNPIMQESI